MLQIGIAGTFDVENYGDLLFPLIAEAELTRRLGPIKFHRFSYYAKEVPGWPYAVTSVAELPEKAHKLDGMIIGGGDLIRFDKNVAPGYRPPNADVHHPTGYWLMPALFAARSGCVVVWNAPGAVTDVPVWATPLMKTALELSAYVSVRDKATRERLLRFADGKTVTVVPDTCFGVSRLVDRQKPSAAYATLCAQAGLTRPYVIIQAAGSLAGFVRFARAHRERLAGYQFLSLPIGPVLGDTDAAFTGQSDELAMLPSWPDPLLIAELIAGASGVVGTSLHLAITALSFGVPLFRPEGTFSGKFAILSQHDAVNAFSVNGEINPDWFKQRLNLRGPDPAFAGIFQALDTHWDKVAACFSALHRNQDAEDIFGMFAQRLPGLLEKEAECGGLRRALNGQYITVSKRDRSIAARYKPPDDAVEGKGDIMPDTMDRAPNGAAASASEPVSEGAIIAERDRQITLRDTTISIRDRKLAELTARLDERDRQLAELTTTRDELKRYTVQLEAAVQAREADVATLTMAVVERDHRLAALTKAVAQLNIMVQRRNGEVRALRESTSWKITAPLRRAVAAVRGGEANPGIIMFERLERQKLNTEPFDWAFANDVFAPRDAQALVASYPHDHFKTVKGYDGEKGYEYEARALIHLGADSIAYRDELSGAWSRLADDLLSADYRAAMTKLTRRDLMGAPMEAYVCHFGPGAWLGPHIDLKDKIMTHVFYFNENWAPEDGGCLNILGSSEMSDSIAEILPVVGNTSILVRASNSWHSVSRVVQGCRTSRRSMNVIFYHPGAQSTMWLPNDTAPLHRYEPEAERSLA
jgi:Polysaccharide pyruvyl transferase/2OG-Fe(II) oxygenase superfamily